MNDEQNQVPTNPVEPQPVVVPGSTVAPQPVPAEPTAAVPVQPATPATPIAPTSAAPTVQPAPIQPEPVQPGVVAPPTPVAPVVPQQPAPTVVDPAVSPQPPVNPVTPAPTVAGPAVGLPAMPQAASANSQPKRKKSLILAGVVIGVILLILAVLAGLFITANGAATKYEASVKTYILDNRDELNGSSASGGDNEIKDQIQVVTKFKQEQPKLTPVPLGAQLSPKYRQAQQVNQMFNKAADSALAVLNKASVTVEFATQVSDIYQGLSGKSTPQDIANAASKIEQLDPGSATGQAYKDATLVFLVAMKGAYEIKDRDPRKATTDVTAALSTFQKSVSKFKSNFEAEIKDEKTQSTNDVNALYKQLGIQPI